VFASVSLNLLWSYENCEQLLSGNFLASIKEEEEEEEENLFAKDVSP